MKQAAVERALESDVERILTSIVERLTTGDIVGAGRESGRLSQACEAESRLDRALGAAERARITELLRRCEALSQQAQSGLVLALGRLGTSQRAREAYKR